MNAEQLIIKFHELSYERNKLKEVNSNLLCEKSGKGPTYRSCIGNLIDQVKFEENRLSDSEFTKRLAQKSCPACKKIWANKIQIKKYSRQIGVTKNQMHALAKKLIKKDQQGTDSIQPEK